MRAATESPDSYNEMLGKFIVSRVSRKRKSVRLASPVVFSRAIRLGVSGSVLTKVVEHVPKRVVVTALNADSTNFSKLVNRKHLTRAQTDDLIDLVNLWAELREFFNDEESLVIEWLDMPIPALDGASPAELVGTQYGRDVIRERLDEMRYGEFA